MDSRTYDLAARRQKSTFIHAVLTVLTCGLWLPVWVAACAENGRIRKANAELANASTIRSSEHIGDVFRAMARDYRPALSSSSLEDDYQTGPEYVRRAREAGWTG